MSVTLLEVLAAAQARCAPLVGEMAGYLVLAVSEQVAVAPRRVGAADVTLVEDGSVRVVGGVAASGEEAEQSLRQLLQRLLVVARSATGALSRACHKPVGAGIESLVRELEAGLIPVNRAAGRRALSRLYRETVHAIEAGRVDPDSLSEPQQSSSPQQSTGLYEARLEEPAPGNEIEAGASVQEDPECHAAGDEQHTAVDAPVAAWPDDADSNAFSEEVVVDPLPDTGGRSSAGDSLPGYDDGAAAEPVGDLLGLRPQEWNVEPLILQQVPEPSESCLPAEEVTRPEPVVARASAKAATAEGEAQGEAAARWYVPPVDSPRLQPALTPPLGSIGAGSDAAPGCDAVVLHSEEPVDLVEDDLTDPMPQGRCAEPFAIVATGQPPAVEPLARMGPEPPPAEPLTEQSPEGPEIEWSEAASSDPLASESLEQTDPEPIDPEPISEDLPGAESPEPPAAEPFPLRTVKTPAEALPAEASPQPRAPATDWWIDEFPPEDGWDVPAEEPSEPDVPEPTPDTVPPTAESEPSAPEPLPDAESPPAESEPATSEPILEAEPAEEPSEPGTPEPEAEAAPEPLPAPAVFSPRRSSVSDLVASFTVAGQQEDGDVCRDLKRIAGVDLTPLPSAAKTRD